MVESVGLTVDRVALGWIHVGLATRWRELTEGTLPTPLTPPKHLGLQSAVIIQTFLCRIRNRSHLIYVLKHGFHPLLLDLSMEVLEGTTIVNSDVCHAGSLLDLKDLSFLPILSLKLLVALRVAGG